MVQERDISFDLSCLVDASHENKWVAIASDYSHVVASANKLDELLRNVSDDNLIFYNVLPRDVSFAPATL